mmetsp:Transcript_7122/g.10645  ORF Transcript_7122/g.10645 Transcript_7122/m.10645 type:complete len:274 (+) Transcript_7122:495-1316(+)
MAITVRDQAFDNFAAAFDQAQIFRAVAPKQRCHQALCDGRCFGTGVPIPAIQQTSFQLFVVPFGRQIIKAFPSLKKHALSQVISSRDALSRVNVVGRIPELRFDGDCFKHVPQFVRLLQFKREVGRSSEIFLSQTVAQALIFQQIFFVLLYRIVPHLRRHISPNIYHAVGTSRGYFEVAIDRVGQIFAFFAIEFGHDSQGPHPPIMAIECPFTFAGPDCPQLEQPICSAGKYLSATSYKNQAQNSCRVTLKGFQTRKVSDGPNSDRFVSRRSG